MKKPIICATVAILILIAGIALVYAGNPPAPPQNQPPQKITLTDQQKQDLAPLYSQMLETKKQIIQKYVEFGYLTQEQADQRIARMTERMNRMQEHGLMMGGDFGGKGRGHHGHGQQPPCPPPADK
ncbi:MAG: hypothetical protein H6Q73_3339 [Firmicutes bacterium]|nr:hypothetical protein [Bacillota bacterium]